MVGEKLNQNSEPTPSQDERSEYPPFDPQKAQELIAQARTFSSAEEAPDSEAQRSDLGQEKQREFDEAIADLADEAEARLGRDLSQEERQDLAESYDEWLKNPNNDPTLYRNESDWNAAHSESARRRREQMDSITTPLPNGQTQEQLTPASDQEESAEIPADTEGPVRKQNSTETVAEEGVGDEKTTETSAEEEQNIELISEKEVRDILGLLNATGLSVDQIFMISRGSKSSEESAGLLKRMFQDMTTHSIAMLNELQNSRSQGKLEAFESVYEDRMGKSFDYCTIAIKKLRENARMLPRQLAGPLIFQLQEVENRLLVINSLATRSHNLENRNTNPTLPKEKLVADEREAKDYIVR